MHRFTAHVPRGATNDYPLDIKGTGKSVSVVVWAIRESGNHALAGIRHEGTDLNHAGTAKILARGQRQYALIAGLNSARPSTSWSSCRNSAAPE